MVSPDGQGDVRGDIFVTDAPLGQQEQWLSKKHEAITLLEPGKDIFELILRSNIPVDKAMPVVVLLQLATLMREMGCVSAAEFMETFVQFLLAATIGINAKGRNDFLQALTYTVVPSELVRGRSWWRRERKREEER